MVKGTYVLSVQSGQSLTIDVFCYLILYRKAHRQHSLLHVRFPMARQLLRCSRETETEFGKELRSLRVERNISQVELANLMGTYQVRISNFERGRVRYPTPATLAKLEEVLSDTEQGRLRRALEIDWQNNPTKRCVPVTELGKAIVNCCEKRGLADVDVAEALGICVPYARELMYGTTHEYLNERHVAPLARLCKKRQKFFRKFVRRKTYGKNVKVAHTVGDVVNKAMFVLELSSAQLAKRIGVSRQSINQVASGECVPRDDLLPRYAKATGFGLSRIQLLARKSRKSIGRPTH